MTQLLRWYVWDARQVLAPAGTAQLVYHDLWGYHSSWYQAGHRQFVAHDLALPARC